MKKYRYINNNGAERTFVAQNIDTDAYGRIVLYNIEGETLTEVAFIALADSECVYLVGNADE